MPTFTYNTDIPDAPNDPSVDQPKMKVNTNSIDDILEVDHISFNAANGGTHKQNTYPGYNVAGAQVGTASTAYTSTGTQVGVTDPFPAYYWRNSQTILPLTAIRAYGFFTANAPAGTTTLLHRYNIASTAYVNPKQFTVTLSAGAVAGTSVNNVVIFVSPDNTATTGSVNWSYSSGVLTINTQNNISVLAVVSFSVLFLQM